MVIWLIGMSGAGKSAIGTVLHRQLREREQRPNTVFIDGDVIREVFGGDLGHTVEDRYKNSKRICYLCAWLDRQGIDVVCAVLSIFPDWQRWNRDTYSRYFEVYVRVPKEVLFRQDSKGIYKKAFAGEQKNVVGVDIDFPEPPNPDVIIDNGAMERPLEEIAAYIVEEVRL